MSIVRVWLLPCALMLGSNTGFAQASSMPSEKPAVFDGHRNPKEDKSRLRDLSGFVRDEAGNPIDRAIVQLKDGRSGKTIVDITKKDGSYDFRELNMDIDYQLTAKRDGYGDPVTKTLSKYDSRKPATLNFELQKKKKSS